VSPTLTWVPRTPNRKTGNIPTAYVGKTLKECRDSCTGCPLLDGTCYAWHGLARLSMGRIEQRLLSHPDQYTIENAMRYRITGSNVARLGAMGDPARADHAELRRADQAVRRAGMDGLLGYTHHWREEGNEDLRDLLLASCDHMDQAVQAREAGWIPAVLLSWDFNLDDGAKTFDMPNGEKGLICPAQTKKDTTCNDCRMCWLGHPVWSAGKISAIGFLDHSRAANREKRSWQKGKQLPLFGARPVLDRRL